MDSDLPPPPSLGPRKLRPWYLVPAMALAWLVGVNGLMSAGSSILFLREATLPDVATAAANARGAGDAAEFFALWKAVELEGIHRIARVAFPLGVAQLLVAALVVIGSGLAMGGRRGTRDLALQALAVNAVLAGVVYALTRGVRGACIDAVVSAAETLPRDLPQRATYASREVLWWMGRFKLVIGEIGTMALGVAALTRPRTRLYFEAVARSTEGAEEP